MEAEEPEDASSNGEGLVLPEKDGDGKTDEDGSNMENRDPNGRDMNKRQDGGKAGKWAAQTIRRDTTAKRKDRRQRRGAYYK